MSNDRNVASEELEALKRRVEKLEVFVQALRGAAGAVIDE